MKVQRRKPYLVYAMIIFFWISMIIGVLYLPLAIDHLQPSVRTLRILSFGGILDPAYVAKFEQKTGSKVELSYYASNEELQSKLKKTGGKGYDLIVPSDYAVGTLREQNLLKPLDKSRMPFLSTINPLLLNHPFDPENMYSIPFEWELYGIGYNPAAIGTLPHASWELIFADPQRYKIVIPNDPIEMITCAAYYLYGHIDTLTDEQQITIQTLLKTQKRWIEAYSSTRAGYFIATGASPLALTTTSYIFTARKYAPHIEFALMHEGGFMTIENFAIPIKAENEDLIYQFLEFIYTPEAAIHHFEEFSNLPAIMSEKLTTLDKDALNFINMSSQEFKKIHFFKQLLPEHRARDLWVAVKS